MGHYLIIFSKDDFSDLHPVLQKHFRKQEPLPFESIRAEVKLEIQQSGRKIFGGLKAQPHNFIGTRGEYYKKLKEYYYSDNENSAKAFTKSIQETESVITQTSDSTQFASPLSLNQEALNTMIRVGSQSLNNTDDKVEKIDQVQSSNKENSNEDCEDFESIYYSQLLHLINSQ
jgi:hypothetical protein